MTARLALSILGAGTLASALGLAAAWLWPAAAPGADGLGSLVRPGVGLALAVGVLAAAALALPRRLLRPLQRLCEDATRIARGDLTRRLPAPSRDEVGEISARLDELRRQFRHLLKASSLIGANLEELVDQRTQELREAQAEKERVVDQLIQAEKLAALGTLASGIGHEINNPLYAILGSAEAIRDEKALGPCREHAREIIKYSKEIAGIVRNLSGYIRPGARHDLEPVDVNAKLTDAVTLARRSVLSDHVEFKLDLGDLPPLPARAEEIQQVFFNVIRNGIQAMQGRGVVALGSSWDGEAISVRIRDTGPGIPDAERGRIFDPFFTTKGPDQGEGLGLYIVQQIVGKYDGTIRVEGGSEAGTTFAIRFPVAAPA